MLDVMNWMSQFKFNIFDMLHFYNKHSFLYQNTEYCNFINLVHNLWESFENVRLEIENRHSFETIFFFLNSM